MLHDACHADPNQQRQGSLQLPAFQQQSRAVEEVSRETTRVPLPRIYARPGSCMKCYLCEP
jgi:hypothetical protein